MFPDSYFLTSNPHLLIMKTLYNIGLIALLLFVTLVFSGCSDNRAPAKVTGTITLDGKPLVGATVTFTPDDGSRISQAMTNAEGWYELRFTAQLKGATVGTHRVAVQSGDLEVPMEAGASYVPETIPKKYNTETELTATLKSGNNVVNFDLASN